MSDEEIPGVSYEAIPVPTTYPLFRCPQGHEQRGSGETICTNYQTGNKVSSGPVCLKCWMIAMGTNYPTSEVKDA